MVVVGVFLVICALPCMNFVRLVLACKLRIVVVVAAKCIKVVRVARELFVSIFAAVRGFLPETTSCRMHTCRRISIFIDKRGQR